jgi:hypothetical protein
MVKGLDFALRLAHLGGRGEGFTNRFPLHFAREPEVGAVARLIGLMTTALRFPTATADGRDGTAAKITQIDNKGQNGAPLLLERTQRIWQVAPPFLTYQYVRNIATKKEPLIVALSCRTPIGFLLRVVGRLIIVKSIIYAEMGIWILVVSRHRTSRLTVGF